MTARAIMVQGTASHAGKSVIAAGLCRVLARRGWRVAPFKSQNMSLNSFVTPEGEEMARAQVVQAECAGVTPSVLMNPVLLKPSGNSTSQLIFLGKPVKNVSAREYYTMKSQALEVARSAYEKLARDYDVIVLEGAGSPAEINLKENDIANMKMAEIADARVLLVADIDRGGVFASIYGTYELLEPAERARIAGYIINKFRGDVTLLDSGFEMLYKKISLPCLGVLPYFNNFEIEPEDSLSLDDRQSVGRDSNCLDAAVIRLPRISNFTDFNPLRGPDVLVRYASRVSELGDPDIIIIPGSKNTLSDLEWLKTSGFAAELNNARRRGTVILGICGGFQMLGREISDPYDLESGGAKVPGLGIFNAVTVMEKDKTLRQVTGRSAPGVFSPYAGEVRGYEIHHGQTHAGGDEKPLFALGEDHRPDGLATSDGLVLGTYLHGLFEVADFRDFFVGYARSKRGGRPQPAARPRQDYALLKESRYDELADRLEQYLRLDQALDFLPACEPKGCR